MPSTDDVTDAPFNIAAAEEGVALAEQVDQILAGERDGSRGQWCNSTFVGVTRTTPRCSSFIAPLDRGRVGPLGAAHDRQDVGREALSARDQP